MTRLPPVTVYRCIKSRRWDLAEPYGHVPEFDVWRPGRWNPEPQWALYTSHEPAVAIEECRRHLPDQPAPTRVSGSIRQFIDDEPDYEVVVLQFEVPEQFGEDRTWDGTAVDPAWFEPLLDPCGNAHSAAEELIAAGMTRLVVRSSPCPEEWNTVLYCFGVGQPDFDAVPHRDQVTEYDRLSVTPNAPDCHL